MSSEHTTDCCATMPRIITEGYQRVGTTKKTEKGLAYYESAENVTNPDVAVITVYDIYGPNVSQTNQQADRISKALGIKVVEPDYFNVGSGFPGDLSAEGGRAALWKWVGEHASPEDMKTRTQDIVQTLRSEGVKKIAFIGFCWGGMQSMELSTIPGLVEAAGALHAREFSPELAARMIVPVINIASSAEPEQPAFEAALPAHLKESYVFIRYDDVPHGFAAARGQWATNETHRKRAEEAIQEVVNFVKKVLIEV